MSPKLDSKISIACPAVGEDEWQAVREPIMRGWLTQGPKVAEFERAFSHRHGVKHAIATTSCTTALHLSLVALDIGPGDEVILPSFTWVATANVVVHCGATPVFVDVHPTTFNLDSGKLSTAITPKTKAVIPVHLFGLCADMDAIAEVAGNVPLIEDAACAAGASYHGRSAGSLGLLGCFSFHPRKVITTGEGGMITTNDSLLANKIESLRNHGASVSDAQRHAGSKPFILPEFNTVGYNYRMSDIHAAIGIEQLKKLDTLIERRKRCAEYYNERLRSIEWLRTPITPNGYAHSWQSYVCYVDPKLALLSRNEIMEQLDDKGVSTRPGTLAVHTVAHLRDQFGLSCEQLGWSTSCADQSLALPLHNKMTDHDFNRVVETIEQIA